MTALEVGGHLNLVDGEKRHAHVRRHGLDGTHPIARSFRNDLFLAGNKGNGVVAGPEAHTIVNLTGEQAQRQTDHARLVGKHALNCQIRLAGICGPENGFYGARGRKAS